ncbi:hypothetical protein [Acetomicrobium sp.]|uniref:hypothetical protein n=1 Tax=Acetomicrobium sp. TaxID=1872099 RepID=UPI002FC8D85A
MKYEIIFSGIGGQGVILAGSLLGEAAVSCGLRAAQTQAYGVSARGVLPRQMLSFPMMKSCIPML